MKHKSLNIFSFSFKMMAGLLMTVSFMACESLYEGGEFKIYEHEAPERPELQDAPGKKGIYMPTDVTNWQDKVSSVTPFWHFSQGTELKAEEPENVEFVPTISGDNIDNALVTELQGLKDDGKISYLLGFNEPDNVDKANMTVERALELWPLLEEVGLPLGSPACVDIESQWMVDFMDSVDAKGLTIDFISMHWHGDTDTETDAEAEAGVFLNKLEDAFLLYEKPIWITGFSLTDTAATIIKDNQYSPGDVLKFMKSVLPELEKRAYILRYAWLHGDISDPQQYSSALWDESGRLTALGTYYAEFKPNTK
ncbi:MAG: glycosyl hydrolase [Bacteroidota bacterium]